jgi:hypothetical protein
MAELFFDKLMGMLGVDTTPQEDQRDPLDTSDPQFGYRDYTPLERAQEVLYGSLDTAGSMLRGVAKAGIEAPRDIYALGSAIGKIQDRSRNRLDDVGPVKTIGELFTEAYNEAPSFLPDEATAERKLYDFTPMSRTYSQDASVYNLPEEFGRIAAPLPILDYARPSQVARLGKAAKPTPRILDARDPITQNTDWRNPALEPLRKPTRQGRFRTQYEDTNIPIDPQFVEQQLAKTDDELLAELRNRTDHTFKVHEIQDKYFQEAPRNLPDGTHISPSVRQTWAYNQAEQELLRKYKAELQNRLIMPSQERQSYIGGKPVPRILEDTPKVEKEPPMLREPSQQARVFNEDGGTGTYSRVEQALLDLKNDPNVPASVTPRSLMQRLEAMGVTKADIEEHGLNLDSITRKNKHGHDVVDIQRVFDEVEPPQERMSRVILGGDRTDSQEMNLQDRFDNEGMNEMPYAEYTGGDNRTAINDYREAVFDDIGTAISRNPNYPYSFAISNFDESPVLTDTINEITKIYKDRGLSTANAEMEAVDALAQAYNNGGSQNWVDELGKILGNDDHWRLDDLAEQWDEARYSENPLIQHDVQFGGETYRVEGNDDFGYRVVDEQGATIVSDVYDLNEVEVRIQNEAINRGTYGYGGEGSMQWAQYLQGDSDYYEPLEEVILTYDPKSGRTFESSHYGSDVAEGYVSHMRTTSRETADGESVYHVDEIQSDLHQEGRQSGYSTAENREELLQANTDYDAAQASADRVYVELRDDIDIPDIQAISRKLDAGHLDRMEARFRDFEMTEAGRNHQRINTAKFHVLDEITDAADPVKLLRDEGINDPDLMRYAEAVKAKRDAYSNVKNLEIAGSAPDAEYPLKDERWIKAMVRQAMERAVSKGDFAGITFSNPQNQINQWSDRYAKLYNEVYENKLKSILETIGKEYGVKPKKVKLNDPEMQDAGENWYLPLTPEMTKSIQSRGVPLASAVGTTPMILDRINKEREDKTPRILRTA